MQKTEPDRPAAERQESPRGARSGPAQPAPTIRDIPPGHMEGGTADGNEASQEAGTETHQAPEANRPELGQVAVLRRALGDIGVGVEHIDARPQVGPTVVRYRVVLKRGERIEGLRRRAEDLAREVGGDVLVSQIVGDRSVAIDLPRPDRQIVPIALALKSMTQEGCPGGLWVPVGVSPSGVPVCLDLAALPHLLLAGATGSGKTLSMLVDLLALALSHSAEQLDIIIIDVKAIDFASLSTLPHLREGHVIVDPEEAVDVLERLIERDIAARTKILHDAGCASLRELRSRRPDVPMKQIVVAIDEYAELTMTLSREERSGFERQVLRLAQRARAVGIHMLIATQRPSSEIISGALKANLPARIAFRLPQRVDSMTIIDQAGAENLLGAGDMLLLHEGRIQRLQGYYVSTSEIDELMASRFSTKGGT
jgi:DNA segregation ATPase FtsK/SpoIIIE-like protein